MERGYDPSRFIFQVKRDLLCCICHRVLKEPRLCEAEEHCFCLSCITQYLDKESQTCPECREPLTLETLKLSQRFLKKVLSEQRIRCDYNDRGCPENVKLRNLEDHMTDCKYRPTLDAEKYNSQVSEKDQQNFSQMKAEFSSEGAVAQVGCDNRPKKRDELAEKYDDMREEMKRMKDETRREMTELKRRHDDIYDKVKKMKRMDTSEVTGEVPAISPTLDTPAVTAVDAPSTSNLSATSALPLSSERATTLAEGTTNEAGPQASGTLNELVGGFDPNRFIFRVRPELICSICCCVLKNPRLCEAGEHRFCFQCISQSLVENSPACPQCRQPLTLETLKLPQSFLKTFLSEQIIKCDHIERGCPKQVELGNLEDHVKSCEFRPVLCENCGLHVDAKDNDNHQRFCQNDGTNVELKKEIDEIKQTKSEINNKVDELDDKVKKMKSNVKIVQRNAMKSKNQVERIQRILNYLVEENIVMNDNNSAQVKDPTIPANNQDIILLGGWYDEENTMADDENTMPDDENTMSDDENTMPDDENTMPDDENTMSEDENTMSDDENTCLDTAEKYNIVERRSTMLPRLNHPRASSASCVYNNDILVVGGYDGYKGTDDIEVLKMDQHPLRWRMFDRKLPSRLSAHDVVVYQGKLYIIGGFEFNNMVSSNKIYEIALTPPYTANLLTRMPEARRNHRAELVNGKLFILGGSKTGGNDATDSVVFYDFIEKEFQPCQPLPQSVCNMSTVTWGDKIIVVGGQDENGQVLNDVIMYDTETEQSKRLPSMIHRRSGCSAVIMNDVIVVFGGQNDEQEPLNSVETFTIGGDGWNKQPGMIEKRCQLTAVVKPRI